MQKNVSFVQRTYNYNDNVSALIAGSSHPAAPKRGTTIISPDMFFRGLEKEHSEPFPSTASQAGFTTVKTTRKRKRECSNHYFRY